MYSKLIVTVMYDVYDLRQKQPPKYAPDLTHLIRLFFFTTTRKESITCLTLGLTYLI